LASQKAFSSRIAVVVGPEGGIDESELSLFEAAGAIRVGLGESILRTSTAGVAAISVIQAALGRFD
jgi:16S rRNA (uracil1498-N3)-methyltransferase